METCTLSFDDADHPHTPMALYFLAVCDDPTMLSQNAAHASHARQRRMHRRKGYVF